MAGFFGADVEQLQLLGRELTQQAEELDSITSRLTSRITSVDWRGPDAQRFMSDWHDRLAVSLRSTAGALRDVSSRALESARQQEDASGAGGAGPLPGMPANPFPLIQPDSQFSTLPGVFLPPNAVPFRIDMDDPGFELKGL